MQIKAKQRRKEMLARHNKFVSFVVESVKCKHFWDNKGKRNRPEGEPMFRERESNEIGK